MFSTESEKIAHERQTSPHYSAREKQWWSLETSNENIDQRVAFDDTLCYNEVLWTTLSVI